jgi:protein-tyrosine phosphatase
MTKILMVCLGNICRSPLAEGILKSKIKNNSVFVDSAGTGAYHVGEKPDRRSITIANVNEIDITDQRARAFTVRDFKEFDYIFVMDNSNRKNVLSLARNDNDKIKVKLILNEVFPNENLDVPDPYYGGEYGFKNVYNMLDQACDKIVEKYKLNG